MKILTVIAAAAAMLTSSMVFSQQPAKPTIILVHGAFADASSWNGVIAILKKDGYSVVAVANPLRSVKSDARYVDDVMTGIQQDKFHQQFAADVSAADAVSMAAGQRPITEAALNEPASAAAWKTVPSWFIYGDADKNIPAQALQFMADRARSKHTEVVGGGSHVVMISNPKAVAKLIERAATNI